MSRQKGYKPVAKRTKSYWCGVRMTPEQRAKLRRLATEMGVKPSAAIRSLIDNATELRNEMPT